jgi:hypothetical protein
MNLLIMQIPPPPRYFLSLLGPCSQIQCFCINVTDQVSHTKQLVRLQFCVLVFKFFFYIRREDQTILI